MLVLGITDIANASVKIKGTIKNTANAKVQIISRGSVLVYQESVLFETYTDSVGNFKAEFNIDHPQELRLTLKEEYTELFLKDGYDLSMSADYKDFDNTIVYTGVGEYDNNFMAADVKEMFYEKAAASLGIDKLEIFKTIIDSLELRSNSLFAAYDKRKFSDEFLSYIVPTLKYRFIDVRWSYRMYMDAKTYKYVYRELPPNYMDFIKEIDINDQAAAGNSRYMVALMRYFFETVDKDYFRNLPESIPLEVRSKMSLLNSYNGRKKVLKGNVLDFELSAFMRFQFKKINESNRALYDSILNDYLSTTKNVEYQNEIISHFSKIEGLSKKYFPKDIGLFDKDGNTIRFSDLEGKVLYVDFWATWCAPCLANMPDSKKLMEEFKNREDIVFVYVNVKDSKKKWLSYLEKNNTDGIQLFANEEVSEKLYKELYIRGIPRYMIVAKDGKLIESVALTPAYAKESLMKALGL
jgi:thiol-disulfide isomerase/thioredoxin